jgi:hypothetical protein
VPPAITEDQRPLKACLRQCEELDFAGFAALEYIRYAVLRASPPSYGLVLRRYADTPTRRYGNKRMDE